MELNDLLDKKGIDPRQVLVFRHRPFEPELNKRLGWLAVAAPDVFNAYQQTQSEKVEKAMAGCSYVASFIGHEAGKALFVGLYSVGASKPLTFDEYWRVPAYIELKKLGMKGFGGERPSVLWFELGLTDFYSCWKGKLIVKWPPPERQWWRRANKNVIPVDVILQESALEDKMPSWDELTLNWTDLGIIPKSWRDVLAQTRGIYYIFDESDGKGYVGSAYGEDNLLGRWQEYASSGHGGNALLRKRKPHNFKFSILQRVSPDMEPNEVIRLETKWKLRLHSGSPFGLNDN